MGKITTATKTIKLLITKTYETNYKYGTWLGTMNNILTMNYLFLTMEYYAALIKLAKIHHHSIIYLNKKIT